MSLLENNVLTYKIGGLSQWREVGRCWQKYPLESASDIKLLVYHDMIIITNSDKAVESFNAAQCKMKGFFKSDTVILAIHDKQNSIRRIKFRLLCSPEGVAQCVSKMAAFFPVVDRGARLVAKPLVFTSVQDTLKLMIERGALELSEPPPAPYHDFVRLCLLDPSFPQLVAQTEQVLRTWT